MSLINTESFAMYRRHTGTVAQSVADRDASAAMLSKGGFTVINGSPTAAWTVRSDPVNPERAALFYEVSNGNDYARQRISWPLPGAAGKPIIIGFSVYVPPNHSYPAVAAKYGILTFGSCPAATSEANALGGLSEIITVYADLTIGRRNGGGTQTTMRLKQGAMNFIEMRLTPDMVRVWMDDAFIFEGAYQLTGGGLDIGLQTYSNMPITTGLNWSFSNFYALVADDTAPNVRLGPTTRVISRKPSSDVSADFLRPNGFASNAEVVAQSVIPGDPPASLQTEDVGARDEYNLAPSADLASASRVHAMVIKALAANLEPTPHALKPWASSGGALEGAQEQILETVVRNVAVGFTPYAACSREDGTIFACGAGPAVYYSQDGGDSWQQGYNGGTAVIAVDIAVGPDGTVVAVCNNGYALTCATAPDSWTYVLLPGEGVSFGLNSIAVSPTGTWVAGVNRVGETRSQPLKVGNAAWTTVSRLCTHNMRWHAQGGNLFVGGMNATTIVYSPTGLTGTWQTAAQPSLSSERWPFTRAFDQWLVFGTIAANGNAIAGNAQAAGGNYVAASWPVSRTTVWAGTGTDQSCRAVATHPDSGRTCLVTTRGGIYVMGDVQGRYDLMLPPDRTFAQVLTMNLEKPGLLPNGGFIIPVCDAAGDVVLIRRRSRNRLMRASDGHRTLINVCSIDPQTGLPWTNTAAALATAGITVTK